MTETVRRRPRRPRLDPEEHARLLAEIEKLDTTAKPLSEQIDRRMKSLRGVLAAPVEEAVPEGGAATPAEARPAAPTEDAPAKAAPAKAAEEGADGTAPFGPAPTAGATDRASATTNSASDAPAPRSARRAPAAPDRPPLKPVFSPAPGIAPTPPTANARVLPRATAPKLPPPRATAAPAPAAHAAAQPAPVQTTPTQPTPKPATAAKPTTETAAPPPAAAPLSAPVAAPAALPAVQPPSGDIWDSLRRIPVDANLLDRNLVITASRTDPAFASFDVVRGRLVQALSDRGWSRVAITSPTKGCGKSFTAVNLAISLSRYEHQKTILLDLDLRHPAVGRFLGANGTGSIGDMLRGDVAVASHLRRPGENALHIGRTLALGLNDRSEPFAAELLQKPQTTEVLHEMTEQFAPDVVLYDLPPALAFDDVIAFRPHFDCVLLVVGGGLTTAAEVREVHRRLGEDKPVLGVILNMAEDEEDNTY